MALEPLSNLVVRPIDVDDSARLARLFQRLSPETIHRRFFTLVPSPPPGALRHLSVVDHDEREALVAVLGDEIVAVARWDRIHSGASEAEIAIVVEDAWQHRGLGHLMMRRLIAAAAAHGITAVTATVLSDNRGAMRLARSMGRPARVVMDGPETRLVFALAS